MRWWLEAESRRRAWRIAGRLTLLLVLCPVCSGAPGASEAEREEIRRFQAVEMPLKGMSIPLARHENGVPKTLLEADMASHPLTNGAMMVTGIVVTVREPDGTLKARAVAARCTFNPETGNAHSEGSVRVMMEGMVVTGSGFDWSQDEEMVNIHRDVRVDLNRKRLMKGRVSSVLKKK